MKNLHLQRSAKMPSEYRKILHLDFRKNSKLINAHILSQR